MAGGQAYDQLGGQYASATLNGSPVATSPYPSVMQTVGAISQGGQSFAQGQASSKAGQSQVGLQDFSPLSSIGPAPPNQMMSPPTGSGEIMSQLLQMIQGLGS